MDNVHTKSLQRPTAPPPPEKKDSPSRSIFIGIVLAIVTAILTFAFSQWQDQRKRNLDFVDLQIEKLYGPLFAFSNATRRAKDDLIAKRRPPEIKDYFDPKNPPTKEDVQVFLLWMRIVFQPMNLEMEKAITRNAQLIQGGHIYPVFEEFIMHVEGYKATMAKWKDSDEDNPHFQDGPVNKSTIDFPPGFDPCVKQRYEAMLARRDHLRNFWVSVLPYKDPSFSLDCQ
jgi:hypothetical protein